jgi:hypothetical protein
MRMLFASDFQMSLCLYPLLLLFFAWMQLFHCQKTDRTQDGQEPVAADLPEPDAADAAKDAEGEAVERLAKASEEGAGEEPAEEGGESDEDVAEEDADGSPSRPASPHPLLEWSDDGGPSPPAAPRGPPAGSDVAPRAEPAAREARSKANADRPSGAKVKLAAGRGKRPAAPPIVFRKSKKPRPAIPEVAG